jgi:predicted metal-dependent hydrolase
MTDFDEYKNFPVAVKVYVEKRSNSRVSITAHNVIVRLPNFLSDKEKQERLKTHLDWAKTAIKDKNLYQKHQQTLADYHQKTIKIYHQDFFMRVFFITSGKPKLSYKGNGNIEFYLKKEQDERTMVHIIQTFLSKFTTKYFLKIIAEETHRLNVLYFQETILEVRLNYTTSKWGSCSSKNKILFSTKLLLLPPKVIEYVIIHELAHLKEMNHSTKFWNWVAHAMPDYKIWDKWLAKHGKEFDF